MCEHQQLTTSSHVVVVVIVRRQSFEQSHIDFLSKKCTSYVKSSLKPNQRHLALYNDVSIEDGTTVQENPFQAEDSLPRSMHHPPTGSEAQRSNVYTVSVQGRDLPSHSAAVDAGLYPIKFPLEAVAISRKYAEHEVDVHDAPTESSVETLTESVGGYPQFADDLNTNQRDCTTPPNFYSSEPTLLKPYSATGSYVTSANVLDLPSEQVGRASQCSSVISDNSYNNSELTSFRGGSTTQLVPTAGATTKAAQSVAPSSATGSGNMSFIETSPTTSMYSSRTSQVHMHS